MQYHVSRNGQVYGPYTLEDLQRYVASGNVLLSDLAKSEEMAEWLPVSQVLSGTSPEPGWRAGAGSGLPPVPPVSPGYGQGYAPGVGGAFPNPPNLHWALVLVFGILTCGVFTVIYDLVQASWLRTVQPGSKALTYYIAAAVFWLINLASSMAQAATSFRHGYGVHNSSLIGSLSSLAFFVLLIVARFSMRQSLEEHYNGPEPIGLRLSGVMTFFFGGLYFQYHFNRINEIKSPIAYR